MDGKSKDLTREYIEQIRGLFPEAVTEVADKEGSNISHKVDMEKLAILLGEIAIPADETEYRQKYGEKFSFEWAGKRRAIAEAQKRSTGTLLPCPAESVEWDDTENLYIEGDNLEVLKLLQDSYLGAVKMIYIDPPYNTGKDFVYKDDYRDNLSNYIEMTNTTNAVNSEASGRYHTNWLNMMYPRLKLARNLLTDDGVIFISIGVEELSNLKSLCNEIFGEQNFIEIFSWVKTSTPPALSTKSRKTNEYILCYERNKSKNKYNGELLDGGDQPLLNTGNSLRILKFQKDKVYFNTSKFPNGIYEPYSKDRVKLLDNIEIINGYATKDFHLEGEFKWTQEFLDNEIITGTTFIVKSELLSIRFIRDEDGYKRPTNFIKEKYTSPLINKPACNVGTNESASSSLNHLMENTDVFSYPKPTSLLKYLANFACQHGDIVMDFFSGSASTAEALFEYNCENSDVTLRYIMVQLPENLDENLRMVNEPDVKKILQNGIDFLDKLQKPHLLTELAKERIRRAGKKILSLQNYKKISDAGKAGLFGIEADDAPKLDIGFKVFKLDRSNVKEWDVEFDGLNEKQAEQQLKAEFSKAMDILKDGRTELDLLYEVMLKLGLQLSTTVDTKQIDGKNVFVVGHGVMIASFAKGLTSAQIGEMVDLKADFIQASEFKVVLSDESFASDNDKTNAMQLFKQRGITNYEII